MANIYANDRMNGWLESVLDLVGVGVQAGTTIYTSDKANQTSTELAAEATKQAAILASMKGGSGGKDNTQIYLIAGGVAVTGLLLFLMLRK